MSDRERTEAKKQQEYWILDGGSFPEVTYSPFDIFSWETTNPEKQSQRADSNSESSHRSCICNGPTCICCVDFNFLYVDLGGPGCVHMKYVSQEEGLAVNVSYGENLIQSGQIRGPNSSQICMPIFSNIAEICANFFKVESTSDGLDGCVQLEPKVLGEFQTQINVGCFSAKPSGMKFNATSLPITETATQGIISNATNPSEVDEEISEEELLVAVSESAQQGLSFFNHLLNLAFGNSNTANATQSEQDNVSPKPTSVENSN
ncbi:uncharacterized protein LOC108738210 isoform X2 [Agrilus planipennis]|uniref:Uncharacterized protein LOC108738210 isoform X2 n=1 Tax=Agrilus planipennis TaxID=224129 RepID=A0A7F5RFQ7_AGRPL|nr:uncharacterized protein LOC108738210 isoform X2 [Agrilus planipennis]